MSGKVFLAIVRKLCNCEFMIFSLMVNEERIVYYKKGVEGSYFVLLE
jgi:hypothetical protein